jgi:putative DNA primase/helicase
MSDFKAAFSTAMAKYDLHPKEIIADGRLHRFSVNGDRGRAGWYTLYGNGVPAGAFGNWKTGHSESWCYKKKLEMTSEEWADQQRKMAQTKRRRDEFLAQQQAKARDKALAAWNAASPDTADHPYLTRKKVRPHGTRVDATGKLLVPIYHFTDSGPIEIHAVQEIMPTGVFAHSGKDKNFPSGSHKQGGFYPIGNTDGDSTVIFCEGFATGASIHEATELPVVCCFDAGNLDPVLQQWRDFYPSRNFIIAGDDDRFRKINAGREKATAAGRKYDCAVVFPKFIRLDAEPTDYNDLAMKKGLPEVKRQIDKERLRATDRADFLTKLDSIREMDDVEYERQRDKMSKDLCIRRSFLDDQRKRVKQEQEATRSGEVVIEDEPWPEPVDGEGLIREIVDRFNRHIVLPVGAATVMAAWVMLTYCYDSFRVLPILGLVSPQKRCGKTTAMEVLSGLSCRALPASNISPAAVFRSIEKFKPALFVDEADSFLKNNEELRGVLNSGHTKATAYVIRCDGENNDPKKFSTWGPKAIAAIGNLPGTIADRSIIVRLKRKSINEKREKIGVEFDKQAPIIRRKILRWVTDNADHLKANISTVSIPGNDRATDNWAPLAAIAGAIGGELPDRLAASARAMLDDIKDDGEDDLSLLLLADIRDAFQTLECDRIFSANLVNHLNDLEERPWSDLKGGKGLSTNVLARFLTPFDISSKTLRIGTGRKKGYERDTFLDSFNRYIPPNPPSQNVTPRQVNIFNNLRENQNVTQDEMSRLKNIPNQLKSIGCHGVTVQKGVSGEDIRCHDDDEILI